MKKYIEVEARSVFGITKIYPVCECAQVFAEIAGTKTLTNEVIKRIKELGYEIKVIAPQVEL